MSREHEGSMQLLLARISAAVTGAMGLVVLAGWYLGASTLPAPGR
ncbi:MULTISPECIES: hypothetical protein [unclassified Cryobacterium]|nr:MULTISPECIES: hypothetical protein [unclassified Cryobacterium]